MNPFRLAVTCMVLVAAARADFAWAQPAHIVLIRHGEKPADAKDNGLSLTGQVRAAALVPYLTGQPEITALGPISLVFAQAAPDPASNSLRPIQTVEPFAKSIGVPLNADWKRDDYKRLADELLNDEQHTYKDKTVLICWEHDRLAEFARYLVRKHTIAGTQPIDPKDKDKWAWPGDEVYGRTWVISYTGPMACEFHDYAQRLLYDDAKHDKGH